MVLEAARAWWPAAALRAVAGLLVDDADYAAPDAPPAGRGTGAILSFGGGAAAAAAAAVAAAVVDGAGEGAEGAAEGEAGAGAGAGDGEGGGSDGDDASVGAPPAAAEATERLPLLEDSPAQCVRAARELGICICRMARELG